MTLIAFISVFVAAFLHYQVAGALLVGVSIYKLAFWTVLTTCFASLVVNKGDKEQFANCLVIAVSMILGWEAWNTTDPVFWNTVLHVALAGTVVAYATTRGSLIVAGLFLLNVVAATLQVSGVLPDRPRVFTGFYYPDLVAYNGHVAMIVTAGGVGDVGKRVRHFLKRKPLAFAHRRARVFNRACALLKVEEMR